MYCNEKVNWDQIGFVLFFLSGAQSGGRKKELNALFAINDVTNENFLSFKLSWGTCWSCVMSNKLEFLYFKLRWAVKAGRRRAEFIPAEYAMNT